MALPFEIQKALDQGSYDSADYRIENAWSGWLLFKNLIDTPAYRGQFFPYSKPDDPIISEPITSTIINRLVSALRKQASYKATINGQDATEDFNKFLLQLDWPKTSMDALAKTLATGGQLFWMSQGKNDEVQVSLTQPYYAGKAFGQDQQIIGFYQSYNSDTRTMLAPIDKHTEQDASSTLRYVDDTSYMKWINGALVANELHNLPFIPAVWADNVDLDESGLYGVPYSNRFKSMLLQLNATLSQKQKSLIFLQNIWVAKTNQANQAGDEPLTLAPDNINYLDIDGSLEQVVRNLDLTEESNQIAYLKKAIYKAAQVPLDDGASMGSLESGVALRILYSQLEEIVSRIREAWEKVEQEVLSKAFRFQYLLDGKADPGATLLIEILYETEIVPQDVQHQLDIDLRLLANNLVTKESLVRKYNKTEADIKLLLEAPELPSIEMPPPSNKAL